MEENLILLGQHTRRFESPQYQRIGQIAARNWMRQFFGSLSGLVAAVDIAAQIYIPGVNLYSYLYSYSLKRVGSYSPPHLPTTPEIKRRHEGGISGKHQVGWNICLIWLRTQNKAYWWKLLIVSPCKIIPQYTARWFMISHKLYCNALTNHIVMLPIIL